MLVTATGMLVLVLGHVEVTCNMSLGSCSVPTLAAGKCWRTELAVMAAECVAVAVVSN